VIGLQAGILVDLVAEMFPVAVRMDGMADDRDLKEYFSMSQQDAQFYAQTYDVLVPDWPGELDFYRALVAEVKSGSGSVLEVACGTGRIALRLAQEGVRIVGLDLSPHMLKVARQKSAKLQTIHWVQADMRSFELDETFELGIIPGPAFQNLLTSEDQVASLECIRRHLKPGGVLVVHLDHQDISWLGELCGEKGGVFEAAEQFQHPQTGRQVRTSRAWVYERLTQTAIVQTVWEEIEADGQIVERQESGPIRLHCVYRFEMEHLLARVGFAVEAIYGDFFRQALRDESTEMIWVARTPLASG
jgi:ubiquinone/menaquinone biosynthesis C-methylase UbiE